jgi:hypothetical protein
MTTGRSWWGRKADDIVSPLLDKEADNVALSIGFTPFAGEETGTAIMVLDPAMEEVLIAEQEELPGRRVDDIHRSIAEYLACSLVFWFWPKMIAIKGRSPDIRFSLFLNRIPVEIPPLDRFPPFDLFSQALLKHDERKRGYSKDQSPLVHEISCLKPVKTLGYLSLLKQVRKKRPEASGMELFDDPTAVDMFKQCHHVALMRSQRLIVKYLPSELISNEHLEYAGVFITNSDDPEVESAFTQSEPPAHDDWVPEDLVDRSARTFVRIALRRILEVSSSFAAPPPVELEQSGTQPLADFSRELGGLLAGTVEGVGAENRLPSPTQSGSVSRPRAGGTSRAIVTLEGPPALRVGDSERELLVAFRVSPASGEDLVHVVVTASAVVEGKAENEAPLNAPVPRVLRFEKLICEHWYPGKGYHGNRINIESDACKYLWRAVVSVPTDTRVEVDISAPGQV